MRTSGIDLTAPVGKAMTLQHPFWIASAHWTERESVIRSWRRLRPAALTLKTSFRNPPKEEKPTVRRRTHPHLPHLGYSLYCDGPKHEEFRTYDETSKLLKYALEMLPETLVGISVIAASDQNDENYDELHQLCPRAAFCELNLKYSFRVRREGEEFLGGAVKAFKDLLEEAKKFLKAFPDVPAFIKISRELNWLPGSQELEHLLDEVAAHGKGGLIIANSLKIDIPPHMAEGREWRLTGGVICGERLFEETISMIRRVRPSCEKRNVPIVATGGMVGPTQVLAALQAGASAVQLCTVFDYKGIDYYQALCWNLEGRIENLGLTSLSEYVDRLRQLGQESAATIYNMPFIYFEKFFATETQKRMLRDVHRSRRMDLLLMSGHTLLGKWLAELATDWARELKKRFGKNLGIRLLLPNPSGSVLAAIQKSWGITEQEELEVRKKRVRETRATVLKLWKDSSAQRKKAIELEKKDAEAKRKKAVAASGGEHDKEPEQEEPEATCDVSYSDQCPFYSFYIFDDRVYVAPYPFTRPGELQSPVYVFLAGTYEYERIDSEFRSLVAYAVQTPVLEQVNTTSGKEGAVEHSAGEINSTAPKHK